MGYSPQTRESTIDHGDSSMSTPHMEPFDPSKGEREAYRKGLEMEVVSQRNPLLTACFYISHSPWISITMFIILMIVLVCKGVVDWTHHMGLGVLILAMLWYRRS
jgi:hypothetical protein